MAEDFAIAGILFTVNNPSKLFYKVTQAIHFLLSLGKTENFISKAWDFDIWISNSSRTNSEFKDSVYL